MRDHEKVIMRRRIMGQRTLNLALAYGTALLCVLAGGLVFSAAPALAAAPETPETGEASAVTATTATLEGGVLNPKAKGEAGEYEYRFRVSETECEGERSTAGVALGEEKEAVPSVSLTELQPNAHYTFCLIEHNLAGEYSLPSTPGHFTTKAAPPAFENESGFSSTQTEATLEAQINPNNQATTCKFEYGTSEALLGAASAPCEPAILEGFPGQHASMHLAGLNPNTVYYYRVAAESGAGKAEGVPIQELRTEPPLPTVTTGEASVSATSATIIGTVNPGSSGPKSEASYFIEYSTGVTPEHFGECSSPCFFVPSFPGVNAGQGTSDVPETALLPGPEQAPLKPHEVYHYRIGAYNGNGLLKVVYGVDATFTTLALAPIVVADPPANLSPNSATLTGSVNAQGVAGTYHFEYGTTTTYGTSLPQVAVAATEAGLGVSANIAGLAPDTTYHVRLVASNNGGATVTSSTDQTFTTYATEAPNAGPLPPGFSLTGTAPAGPAAVAFPDLTGLVPLPPARTTTELPKPVTNAQRLRKALKACKPRSTKRRSVCELHAIEKYGPAKKAKGKKGT